MSVITRQWLARGLVGATMAVSAIAGAAGLAGADPDDTGPVLPSIPTPSAPIIDDFASSAIPGFHPGNHENNPAQAPGHIGMVCQNPGVRC